MMDGTHRSDSDPPSGNPTNTLHDDETVATPPRGGKAKTSKSTALIEKTLRFRFPPMLTGDPVAPSTLHAHWMCAIQQEFGDAVQIIDNQNRVVPKIDPTRLDPKNIKAHFIWHSQASKRNPNITPQTKSNDRRTTQYLLHRIRTSCSLRDLKTNPKVKNLLKSHDFYVNDHRWNETDWDTIQLGFMFGIDPSFYDVDQATAKINADLQKEFPRNKIPQFRLVFASPKVKFGRNTYSTKAYAIESQRSTSREMISILKTVFKSTGAFVPFQMRQKHPDAFQKLIRAQTRILSKNRVIILNNIGSAAMYYMTDHITSVHGVQALLPTKHTEELGRYKVLVTEKDFQSVRNHMKKYLLPWYEQYVEPDALNPEFKYPGVPTVAQIDADDYSDDEDSYMTVSVNTAMSVASALSEDTNEEPDIPAAVGCDSPSWANVASDESQVSRNNIGTSPQGSNRTDADLTSALSSSQAEVSILRDQVAELRAEREKTAQIIADAVKQQVAEALAAQIPSHVREDHVTSQQFSMFIQAQERKFDTLTTMFSQMLSAQRGHESQAPSSAEAPIRYQDDHVHSTLTLGKRTAQEEMDPRTYTDSMDISEFETNRKRIDSRQTPEKGGTPRVDHDHDVPDLVPRRLLSESPCNVPLPDSPQNPSQSPSPSQSEQMADTHSARPAQIHQAQSAKLHQQSISQYLRVDPTGTTIQQDTPPLSRQPSGELADERSDFLSEVEEASHTSSSGNESKQQVPESPIDCRESSNQKS
jgi:hypothetical protein